MGKQKGINSEVAIRNLFDQNQLVQANCVSTVGNIPLNTVTYTKINNNRIQLNANTVNLQFDYMNALDVDDFLHDIIQDSAREQDTFTRNNLYDDGTLAFSVEMPSKALKEEFKINDLKLTTLVLMDEHKVIYQLLFINSKIKPWLTKLLNIKLTKRNLISLFSLLGNGLLGHSRGFELTTFTSRSRVDSSKLVSNQPIVMTDYDEKSKNYTLTLADTTLTFNQDRVDSSKLVLDPNDGYILEINLDNQQLLLKI